MPTVCYLFPKERPARKLWPFRHEGVMRVNRTLARRVAAIGATSLVAALAVVAVGGTSQNVQLPGLTFQTGGVGAFHYFDAAGDPVLAFGDDNTVYYGNIAFSRTPFEGGQMASAIVVSVSHDGGLNWGNPAVLAL